MGWTPTKRTVLVPFDFSSPCAAGLEAAQHFVEEHHDVVALNVIEPDPHLATLSDVGRHERAKQVISTRKRLAEALETLGFPEYRHSVRLGAPSKTIVDEANQIGADLIVIPSHGRTGLPRWFLGSVTEHVVRHAECPVLVLGRSANVEKDAG